MGRAGGVCLALGQGFDGGDELEAFWEELCSSRQHQFVRLSDGDVSHTRNVRDLFLRTFVARCLLTGKKRIHYFSFSWLQKHSFGTDSTETALFNKDFIVKFWPYNFWQNWQNYITNSAIRFPFPFLIFNLINTSFVNIKTSFTLHTSFRKGNNHYWSTGSKQHWRKGVSPLLSIETLTLCTLYPKFLLAVQSVDLFHGVPFWSK